jgi:hypothetical protein
MLRLLKILFHSYKPMEMHHHLLLVLDMKISNNVKLIINLPFHHQLKDLNLTMNVALSLELIFFKLVSNMLLFICAQLKMQSPTVESKSKN